MKVELYVGMGDKDGEITCQENTCPTTWHLIPEDMNLQYGVCF
jgi:membrane-bound lytic murein transglycosylase